MAITKRKLPSGTTAWRVRVYLNQRVVAEQSFSRLSEARRWEADQESKLRAGEWIDPARGKIAFAEVAEEWQSSREHLAVRSQETTRFLLNRYVLPKLGRLPVAAISSIDVENVLTAMTSRGLAIATQRRTLSVIRLVLQRAVDDKRLAVNVAQQVKQPRGPVRHEPRWLTAPQLQDLVHAVPAHCRPVVLFLGLTGARFSEMAALTAGDVIQTRHGLGVRIHRAAPQSKTSSRAVMGSTKTHVARTVPVPAPLLGYVEERTRHGKKTDYLFPSPTGTIWTNTNFRLRAKWSQSLKKAGLTGTRIHDLRHTAASLLIASGADLKSVQGLLGHASGTMTMDLYGHLFEDAPWRAMEHLPHLELGAGSGQENVNPPSTGHSLATRAENGASEGTDQTDQPEKHPV